MSELFESLSKGLEEAISYEQGKGAARVTIIDYRPVKDYLPKEIRQIRMNAGMSQANFAGLMGVSVKTVEAWECGRNHPTGPARRLLEVLEANQGIALPFAVVREVRG